MIRPPLEDNADGLSTAGAPPMQQQRLPQTLGPVRVRRLMHDGEAGQEFDGVLPSGVENLCVSLIPTRSLYALDGRPVRAPGGPAGSFAIPAGARVSGRHGGEVDFIEFRIATDALPALLEEHDLRPGGGPLRPDYLPVDTLLATRLAHLRFAMAHLPRLDSLYLDAMLEACLAHLLRRHAASSHRARRQPSLSPTAMRRVFEYVDAHVGRALRLEELASVAHISRAHFARAFHHETGFTPHRWVMQRRVETALSLLRTEPRLALSAIASRAGFADHAHLTRTFRRELRATPTEVRVLLG